MSESLNTSSEEVDVLEGEAGALGAAVDVGEFSVAFSVASDEGEHADKEVKLPSISFGYYHGRGLSTMHTNIMLMLSGCRGEGLVERVKGRMIERTLDMSESLLLDPEEYSKLLSGRSKNNVSFMEAFRSAASEKSVSLMSHSDGYPYPTVVAFSLVEGEQGIDPITVCEDLELHGNSCTFSHVELKSGALCSSSKSGQIQPPLECNRSNKEASEGSMQTARDFFDVMSEDENDTDDDQNNNDDDGESGKKDDEEEDAADGGEEDDDSLNMFTANSNFNQVHELQDHIPRLINIPAVGADTTDDHEIPQHFFSESDASDGIEISFFEYDGTSPAEDLFQVSWNYPPSNAMVFDE